MLCLIASFVLVYDCKLRIEIRSLLKSVLYVLFLESSLLKNLRVRYEKGVPVVELENGLLPTIGKTKKTGTRINFLPDPEIFEKTRFKEAGHFQAPQQEHPFHICHGGYSHLCLSPHPYMLIVHLQPTNQLRADLRWSCIQNCRIFLRRAV